MREMKSLERICLGIAICALMFSIAACAPKENTDQGDTQEKETTASVVPTKLPTWTAESKCASCHKNESSDDGTRPYAAHAAKGLTCLDCHTNANGELAAAHKNYAAAKSPTALVNTKVDAALCQTCHSADTLKSATAGSAVLTDATGRVVNPHGLPDGEGHADITCPKCHNMHAENAPATDAKNLCVSCHHTNEFVCKTCHE